MNSLCKELEFNKNERKEKVRQRRRRRRREERMGVVKGREGGQKEKGKKTKKMKECCYSIPYVSGLILNTLHI